MDDMKIMVVQVALKDMLSKGHFSICTIDKILSITGAIPNGEAYRLLSALHCVDFKDMPPELLRGLPVLVERVIGSERIEFDYRVFGKNIKLAA